eukprot:2302131-Amphidinium_carterae.4
MLVQTDQTRQRVVEPQEGDEVRIQNLENRAEQQELRQAAELKVMLKLNWLSRPDSKLVFRKLVDRTSQATAQARESIILAQKH